MHGKPSAKLVPAHHLDDLLTEGAGFAGFAAGDIGQGPHDPDMIAMPGPDDADDPAVAADRRAVRLRRHGRGRGVALLPAHDPAPRAGPGRRSGLRAEARRRARVLPRAPHRGRRDRGRRPARHARSALLRHARADPQPRLRLGGLEGRHGARVGQLRDRPRGRQRAVRAELPVRRRADDLRPRRVLPLHGRVARAAARADRDVHAQAVRPPDRQRLPLPRQPLEGRREPVRARPGRRPARARALRARLQLHRRTEGQRARPTSRSPRRPSTPTSDWSSAHRRAAPPGRRRTSATATTTAPRCCGSPHPDGSRTAPSTAPATPTWPRRRCSPPASTASSAGSTPATRTPRNLYALERRPSARQQGIDLLPANLLDATRELERTQCSAGGARQDPRRRLHRLLRRASSGARSRPPTSRSPSGSSTATCSCSDSQRSVRLDVPRAEGRRKRAVCGPAPNQQRPRRIHIVRSGERQREAR